MIPIAKSKRPIRRPSIKSEVRKYCYLCSDLAKDKTREHVIAKSLFKPNRLEQPIILTACRSCNQKIERDEAYTVLQLQALSNNKYGYESFQKSISLVEKKFKENGEKALNKHTKGIGLIMGLKKNTQPLEYIMVDGVPERFGGGYYKIDVKRLNEFLVSISKGLVVSHTEVIHDWTDYETRVVFDQTEFSTQKDVVYPAFSKVTENADFAEQWESAAFIAGVIRYSKKGDLSALIALNFFESFAAVIAISKK